MNEHPHYYRQVSTCFLFAFTTDFETSCVTRDVFIFGRIWVALPVRAFVWAVMMASKRGVLLGGFF